MYTGTGDSPHIFGLRSATRAQDPTGPSSRTRKRLSFTGADIVRASTPRSSSRAGSRGSSREHSRTPKTPSQIPGLNTLNLGGGSDSETSPRRIFSPLPKPPSAEGPIVSLRPSARSRHSALDLFANNSSKNTHNKSSKFEQQFFQSKSSKNKSSGQPHPFVPLPPRPRNEMTQILFDDNGGDDFTSPLLGSRGGARGVSEGTGTASSSSNFMESFTRGAWRTISEPVGTTSTRVIRVESTAKKATSDSQPKDGEDEDDHGFGGGGGLNRKSSGQQLKPSQPSNKRRKSGSASGNSWRGRSNESTSSPTVPFTIGTTTEGSSPAAEGLPSFFINHNTDNDQTAQSSREKESLLMSDQDLLGFASFPTKRQANIPIVVQDEWAPVLSDGGGLSSASSTQVSKAPSSKRKDSGSLSKGERKDSGSLPKGERKSSGVRMMKFTSSVSPEESGDGMSNSNSNSNNSSTTTMSNPGPSCPSVTTMTLASGGGGLVRADDGGCPMGESNANGSGGGSDDDSSMFRNTTNSQIVITPRKKKAAALKNQQKQAMLQQQ